MEELARFMGCQGVKEPSQLGDGPFGLKEQGNCQVFPHPLGPEEPREAPGLALHTLKPGLKGPLTRLSLDKSSPPISIQGLFWGME